MPSIKIESIGPYSNPRNAITLFLNVSTFFLKPPDRGAEIAKINGRAEIASDLISPETNPFSNRSEISPELPVSALLEHGFALRNGSLLDGN